MSALHASSPVPSATHQSLVSFAILVVLLSSVSVEGLMQRTPTLAGARAASASCSASALFQLPPSNQHTPSFQENVYIPQSELEKAIQREEDRHERECEMLQSTIEHQRQELQQLRDNEHKERLRQKMNHDATWGGENQPMMWSENHAEKMQRFQGRLQFLTEENLHLHAKMDMERARHEQEVNQLHMQLAIEKEKAQDAKNILGLERSYYETSVTLLEKGLEREGRKVKALQTKLKEQKMRQQRRMGARSLRAN